MSDVPKTAMDFRVATYNILCSHLAEPDRFPMCDPKNLDAPTRLTKVKQKLDREVSQCWSGCSSHLFSAVPVPNRCCHCCLLPHRNDMSPS